MKNNRRRVALILAPAFVASLLFMAQPAQAFFSIVFDPSSYAALGHIWSQDISTYAKMTEEFNQLVKIYTTGTQIYQAEQYMQNRFSQGMRQNWMMATEQVVNNQTQSRYGQTVLWPQMMNDSPQMAPQAWSMATSQLGNTAPMIGSMSAIQQAMLKAAIAGVEIADGTSVECLQTISQQHANAPFNLAALKSLGITFKSDSPATNALIQQLNMGNSATQQAVTLQHQGNSMQNCVVQGQIVANKMARDEEVNAINRAIQAQSVVQNSHWNGTDALGSTVLP